MSPRLVVVSGELAGSSFPLEGDELTVGRSRSCGACLPDETVSRRHCVIRRDGDGYAVEDLETTHGVVVDGERVDGPRRLSHGQRLVLGDCVLQFLVDDDASPAGGDPRIALDALPPREGTTVELRPEDSAYLHVRRPGRRASDRVVADLGTLVHVSAAINRIADPQALQERLLELVLEVIPAERGAILLSGPGHEILSTVVRGAGDVSPGTLRVSRTVVDRVLREGVAILANDLGAGAIAGRASDERLNAAESVRILSISAVLAVPLELHGRRLGVLYLHARTPSRNFDAGHLELATAIASLAAVALDNARRISWAESEAARLRADLDHDLVGGGRKMADVLAFVGKVAPKDATVLIRGESGTGKELVARAIHRNSTRSAKSFVAINCAAIPETLIESELFGHEKGAFTGASAQKKGRIELADGGTLFLDEIGELPPLMQAKLLRVLQEREVERVGGTRPIRVDVRLIAATNRDLEEAIKAGTFRQDLFYRLNVVSTSLPPLRERREDIPSLAAHFLERLRQRFGGARKSLSPDAAACLAAHDWPGNVRELENALERAVVLASGDVITPEDLPEALLDSRPADAARGSDFHEAVRATKRRLVLEAVERAGGSWTEAARLLGLNANYLHRLAKNLDIK